MCYLHKLQEIKMDALPQIQYGIFLLFVIYVLLNQCLLFYVTGETLGNMMTFNTTLKANQSQTLISPNGIFEIGFYTKNYSAKYTLAIWYANIPTKTIVWMADTSMSLNNDAYLFLSKEGELQVFDGNSSLVVWSSNTFKLNVTGAKILDIGNFVIFYNTHYVWQSFDSPTDTLLPEQLFKRKNNVSMYAMRTKGPWIGSKYIMNWSNNSIAVSWESSYYNSTVPSYYWNSNSTTPLISSFYSYVVLTTKGEFIGVSEGSQSSTSYYLISQSNDIGLPGRLRRLTLDYDGNLQIYSWYIGTSTEWIPQWKAVTDVCKIFGFCGPSAWCDNGMCYCPEGYTPIDPTNTLLGCKRTPSLTCNNTQVVNDMVALQSVDYPCGTSDYAQYLNNIMEEDCIAKCLAFCLCEAVSVSRTISSEKVSCWLKEGILVNGRYDETRITYFKVEPKTSRKQGLSLKFILTLIIFILGPIVIILGLISSIFGYALVSKKIKAFKLKKIESKWMSAHGTIVKFSSTEIKLVTKNFAKEIGKGGYGTVYKGKIGCDASTKQLVAVKRLDKLDVGEKEFVNEVDIIGRIHHANLVHLLGYCAEQHQRMIIYEYMEKCSLDKFLFQNKKSEDFVLDWQIRFNIAIQTAKGLAYLHNDVREQRIIHCDVKPENILLDSNFCAKVADFGMSQILKRDQTCTMTRQIRGTFGYLAPEWTSDQMPITPKTDVYSYGMVLLEIVGGRRNLKSTTININDLDCDWYFPLWAYSKIDNVQDMFKVLDPLLYGLANPLELERILKVAFWCINDQPHLRPSMSMVVHMLEGHIPIELPVPQPKFLMDMATLSQEEYDDVNIHEMFTTSTETSEGRKNLVNDIYV